MKKIKYLLEYAPVLFFDALFCVLPQSWAVGLGKKIGLLMSSLLAKRKQLVLDNLSRALPEKSSDEIHSIATQVWQNIGRVAAEFVRMGGIDRKNFKEVIGVSGFHHYEEALKQNKGVILVGFHFTNWEYTGISMQHYTQNVVAIARPAKNPFVERWIQNKRAKSGMSIILHRQAVKESLRALRQKKAIGILVDQNLYTGGEFVDFFGRPAATTTLPALLHSRTGSPTLIIYTVRKNGKYCLVIEPPLHYPGNPKDPGWLKESTQLFTKKIEAIIRQTPENWFWIHNRWKRSPTP